MAGTGTESGTYRGALTETHGRRETGDEMITGALREVHTGTVRDIGCPCITGKQTVRRNSQV